MRTFRSRTRSARCRIHIAAFLGHAAIVEALLEAGADRFARDMDGSTALDIALTPVEDDRPVLEHLVKALGPLGFSVDYDAIAAGRKQIAEMLKSTAQERGAVNYTP